MRVLCCVDGTNIEPLSQAVSALLKEPRTLGILYVTDSGPEMHMELHRERLLRPARPAPPRKEQMRQAEESAAREILAEGSRFLGNAETLWRSGRPEQEIVQAAREWQAETVVICSRSSNSGWPPLGPKSVGHVARFVLDHAPCPVLLVRPLQLPPN